jgi:WD40 repeat protein
MLLLVALVVALGPGLGPQAASDAEGLLALGRERMAAGDAGGALEAWEGYEELRPGDALGAYLQATALAGTGERERALDEIDHALELGWSDAAAAAREVAFAPLAGDQRFAAALRRMHARGLERRRAEVAARREHLARIEARSRAALVHWQLGHAWGAVDDVRFSPDGERLLTSGVDGTVHLWAAHDGAHIAALGPFAASEPYSGDVRAGFDASGDHLLVLDRRAARATLWDGESGALRAELVVGGELVTDAAFTRSGERVLTGTAEGLVRVWDASTGERVAALEAGELGVVGLRVTPDGARGLAIGGDGRARLFDLATLEPVATLGAPEHPVLDRVWSPDGRFAVTSEGAALVVEDLSGRAPSASVAFQGARLFEGALRAGGDRLLLCGTRGPVYLASLDAPEVRQLCADTRTVGAARATAFTRDGARVLCVGPDGVFRLWDATSGEPVAELAGTSRAFAGAFAPDGRTVAVAESAFAPLLFDAASGERRATFTGLADSVASLAFSPDGRRLAAGTHAGYAAVWSLDAPDRPTLFQPRSRTLWGWSQGLSPDGRFAVSAGFPRAWVDPLTECVAHVWDTRTGAPLSELAAPGAVVQWAVCGPRSKRIATAGSAPDGAAVVDVWDAGGKAPSVRLACGPRPDPARKDLVTGMVFDAEGRRLCTTTYETGVRLWDAGTGALLAALPELAGVDTGWAQLSRDGTAIACPGAAAGSLVVWTADGGPRTIAGHAAAVRNVAFDPEGRRVVSASLDGSARVWDVASGAELLALESPAGPVRWAEFGLDGRVVVTCEEDSTARVWDAATGALLHELAGGPGAVSQCAVAPRGDRVVILGTGDDPRVYALADGALLAVLRGHAGGVGGASFSADGSRILTSGLDDAVRLWDADGRLRLTRVAFERGEWLAFEPGGGYVATPRAAEWAFVEQRGRAVPLASYAEILGGDAGARRVRASLSRDDAPEPPESLPSAPELRIVEPRGDVVRSRSTTLAVLFEDELPIAELEVLQDGAPLSAGAVEAALAYDGPRHTSGRLELALEIPPERARTEVEVRATNSRRVRTVAARTIGYEPPYRDLYVVTLAVADYDDDGYDLDSPVDDARDLAARLQREAGGLFRAVHVASLADREVEDSAVVLLRDEFLRRAGPEDTVVVFVAGHGVRNRAGNYFLLTSGATAETWNLGIDRDRITSLISPRYVAAQRLVLLIDTCQAGLDPWPGERGRAVDAGPYTSAELARERERLGTGRYILPASSPRGAAREAGGNGLFTRAVLDALDGAGDLDGNGTVEVDELARYAEDAVRERSGGEQQALPALVEAGGRFPLARVPAPPGR